MAAADISCNYPADKEAKTKLLTPRTFLGHLGLNQFPVRLTKNGQSAEMEVPRMQLFELIRFASLPKVQVVQDLCVGFLRHRDDC